MPVSVVPNRFKGDHINRLSTARQQRSLLPAVAYPDANEFAS